MDWHSVRLCRTCYRAFACVALLSIASARQSSTATSSIPPQNSTRSFSAPKFIREFSRAEDVTRDAHPVLNKSLDIVAGPADPHAAANRLVAPQSVATDSLHRVFVADSDAGVVHVFDFEQFRYSVLKDPQPRTQSPVSVAVDRDDNVYVADTGLSALLVYDSKGRFLRYLGKGEGTETYFENPLSIAIQATTGRIYVCDSRRHMILQLDKKGRIVGRVGKRGSGSGPAEFRYPSRIAIAGDELFVLDSGNSRLQVLDLSGHFHREIKLPELSIQDGMAVDSQKNVYVSDVEFNVINVFDSNGQLLYKFGGGSKAGEFQEPTGLWIDFGNRLYVADMRNHRVQLFQIEQH